MASIAASRTDSSLSSFINRRMGARCDVAASLRWPMHSAAHSRTPPSGSSNNGARLAAVAVMSLSRAVSPGVFVFAGVGVGCCC